MTHPVLRFRDDDRSEFPEWKTCRLGDVCETISGGTPSTANPDYWDGEINWLTPTEINSKYVHPSKRKISEDGYKNSSVKEVPQGAIILTTRASIGLCCLQNTADRYTTNQGFQSVNFDSTKVYNEYGYYCICSPTFQCCMMKLSSGSTFLEISPKNLKGIAFHFPSLPEQKKIADFLSSIDEKISSFGTKLDLLKQYKKSVMQEILNQKIRFKADDGSDFPEWKQQKLSEVFRITRGQVLAVDNLRERKDEIYCYPVFSSQTKNNGLMGYYKSFLYEDAITWTTDGANAGDTNYRKGRFFCTNVCGVLINNKGYANECIAYIINSVSKKYVSYVGNPKLMNNIMGNITIHFPSLPEQKKIADFLSSIDEKISLTHKQLLAMEEYKKGLMQQLFV